MNKNVLPILFTFILIGCTGYTSKDKEYVYTRIYQLIQDHQNELDFFSKKYDNYEQTFEQNLFIDKKLRYYTLNIIDNEEIAKSLVRIRLL